MAFETMKSGWLQRQKKITKKWKRQWFVLTTDGMLRYFDNEYCTSAEDAARMKVDCLRITTDNNILGVSPPDSMSRSSLLQIEFRSKTWNLCAESPDDMKAWQFALEDSRLLEMARPSTVPQVASQVGYPQQTVVQSYPNNVVYVNGGQRYMYPDGGISQQVIRHPNGHTTVVVNQQPYRRQRHYGYGLGPLWYW